MKKTIFAVMAVIATLVMAVATTSCSKDSPDEPINPFETPTGGGEDVVPPSQDEEADTPSVGFGTRFYVDVNGMKLHSTPADCLFYPKKDAMGWVKNMGIILYDANDFDKLSISMNPGQCLDTYPIGSDIIDGMSIIFLYDYEINMPSISLDILYQPEIVSGSMILKELGDGTATVEIKDCTIRGLNADETNPQIKTYVINGEIIFGDFYKIAGAE